VRGKNELSAVGALLVLYAAGVNGCEKAQRYLVESILSGANKGILEGLRHRSGPFGAGYKLTSILLICLSKRKGSDSEVIVVDGQKFLDAIGEAIQPCELLGAKTIFPSSNVICPISSLEAAMGHANLRAVTEYVPVDVC